MDADQFEYEIVINHESHEERKLNLFALTKKRIRQLRISLQVKWRKYQILFILAALMIANYNFYNIPRACDHDSNAQCWTAMVIRRILPLLRTVATTSVIFSLLIIMALYQFLNFKYLLLIVPNYVILINYYNADPSLRNYSALYNKALNLLTFLVITLSLFITFQYYLLKWVVKRRKFIHALFVIVFVGLISFLSFHFTVSNGDDWYEGVLGKHLQEKTDDGQPLCEIKKPHYDWYKLLDGLQDLSHHYYDCTKYEFNDFASNKQVLSQYLKTKKRFVAYPRLDKLTDSFDREYTQKYLLENSMGYDNLEDIPIETEYILDTTSLTYHIKVNRNSKLIEEREKLRSQNRTKPKNVIVLYIDALSRTRFNHKLPKLKKWLESFNQKHKDKFSIYEGMRAVSVAGFTWPNLMAYLFGLTGHPDNVFDNSPYTLREKVKVTRNVTAYNARMGKNITSKAYGDGKTIQEPFIEDFKRAGYITAVANTDCATSPASQERIHGFKLLKNVIYDHNGIIPACDPNYFYPKDVNSLGGGPYSIFRRCLYGKELISYSQEYAKQFLTNYKDQNKFLEMEFIEAHEGTGEVIKYYDQSFVDLMEWMQSNGHLDDSVFILLSDHGMHLNNLLAFAKADIMMTEIGLPIQIILFTTKLLNAQDQKQLLLNEQKLTTLFELHYFLKFLVIDSRDTQYYRDNSLISDKISNKRSSYDLPMFAGLPLVCQRVKI